ncbi:MAG: septum site-determining protein MinC [Vulcanimicrobiaceae bacterium]
MAEALFEPVASMTLLRGKGLGLEVAMAERDFEEALAELEERLAERPDFYRGTAATAAFGAGVPDPEQIERLRAVLHGGGIDLTALSGVPALAQLALELGLTYVPAVPDGGAELARRRALRPKRDLHLSEGARSLAADFAGARADIAERRKQGESSVRRAILSQAQHRPPESVALALVEAPPTTLYHVGTLRGGQSLHNVGNIVVVGDVNPGAELVASGDIVVFGSLRGVAHAGAQGDSDARVYALDLAATQLRIATFIAADGGERARGSVQAEVACVQNDRIAIVAYDRAENLLGGTVH